MGLREQALESLIKFPATPSSVTLDNKVLIFSMPQAPCL